MNKPQSNTKITCGLLFAWIVLPALLLSEAGEAQTRTMRGTRIEPFLTKHCIDCHSGADAEAEMDLESMSINLHDARVRERWVYLHDRVAQGEMPPDSADGPDEESKAAFLKSLATALTRADQSHREVVLRRLNGREYENTVRDLFGIYLDVSTILIDDGKQTGFDNVGSDLSVSGEQMQLYLEAADEVLDQVFGPPRQPARFHRAVPFAEIRSARERADILTEEGGTMFGRRLVPMWAVSLPRAGLYRVKIRAKAVQSDEPLVMRVSALVGGSLVSRDVGFYEFPPDKMTTVEFTDRAGKQDRYQMSYDAGYPFWELNADGYTGPGLFIEGIEIEGPVEPWPPASRQALLGDLDVASATLSDAKAILELLLPRAFRRPIGDDDLAPYLALAEQASKEGHGFEASLRRALQGVLCSPEFLYLEETPLAVNDDRHADSEQPARINDFALASRLSYFLWSSMPDDELFQLARRGELREPKVLREQVERMLGDPKSRRFVQDFSDQWLRLRDIDFTSPDFNLYPEYQPLLRQSMLDETHAFFAEVLEHDLSVQNFVDSDFAMLNQAMAEHYSIDGVKGLKIRRVELPADSVRGGVLTHASVLKVSADGTRTSPVLRGAWVLEHLYGNPPPPPPASVSAIEPDLRGATTVREQLAKHRSDQSCNRCHRNIDPPGFALESFDVIGKERTWSRTRNGKWFRQQVHPHSETNVPYRRGPDVDPSGVTPDGRKFAGITQYKQLLLEDETAMAHSLARQLLSYALGRKLGFSDRPDVDRIVAAAKPNEYGLRSIVHEVVQSEPFRSP